MLPQVQPQAQPQVQPQGKPQPQLQPLSSDAATLLGWVRRSGDNRAQPFVVVDKQQAHLWLFDAGATLIGSTVVLVGAARGDHSVPDIGDRPMNLIQPDERTTPAGRFVAEVGVNASGEDIFWVDYDAAVSMHRVRAHRPEERRLQRLASATPDDNRISYGCINVPARFYDGLLRPAFHLAAGVVYVLPENLPLRAMFPSVAVP